MVYLVEISKDELPEIILFSYKGDKDLLNKYHIQKFTLKEAVKSELDSIDNISKQIEFDYFKVLYQNKSIGYVVSSGSFLYSFAISIEYRTKNILQSWWVELKNRLGENFKCGLMSNNTRAIRYMEARGMRIEYENPLNKEVNEILLTN